MTTTANLVALVPTLAASNAITLNQKIQLNTRLGLLNGSIGKASDAYAAWVASPSTSTKTKAKTALQLAGNNAANVATYLASSGIAQPGLGQLQTGITQIQSAITAAQAKLA